jgi:hypothetical protein
MKKLFSFKNVSVKVFPAFLFGIGYDDYIVAIFIGCFFIEIDIPKKKKK